MPTDDERLAAEANRLYWKSDAAVAEIAERLGISRRAVYRALRSEPAGTACPDCSTGLVFANRSARSAGESVCPGCGAEHDLALLRELNADAGSTLRSRSASTATAADSELEQEWIDGDFEPLDTEAALLRSRALFIGGAALAGAVVGAVAALVASRR